MNFQNLHDRQFKQTHKYEKKDRQFEKSNSRFSVETSNLIGNDNSGNSFLGHYTSCKTAIEDILPSRQIRFSPFRKTNDPKENMERVFGISGRVSDNSESDLADRFTQLVKKLKMCLLDYSKVLCLTKSHKNNPLRLNTKKAFGRPRMWAQYAANHKGICLLFNQEQLGNSISYTHQNESKQIWCGQVQYLDFLRPAGYGCNLFSNDRVMEIGEENAVLEHLENFKDALFFRKDSDWSGEDEWRWIVHKWQEGYEYVSIEKSLKAIVLGTDFHSAYLPSIKKLSNELEVEVFQLSWNSLKEDFDYNAI